MDLYSNPPRLGEGNIALPSEQGQLETCQAHGKTHNQVQELSMEGGVPRPSKATQTKHMHK